MLQQMIEEGGKYHKLMYLAQDRDKWTNAKCRPKDRTKRRIQCNSIDFGWLEK